MAFVRGVDNRNFLPARPSSARSPARARAASLSFLFIFVRPKWLRLSPTQFCPLILSSLLRCTRKIQNTSSSSDDLQRKAGGRPRKFRALEHIINPLFENLIKGIREADEVPFRPTKKYRAVLVRTTRVVTLFILIRICSFIFARLFSHFSKTLH